MTRETARIKVEQLDNYLSHTCQDYGERDHEAMMMAIKALEQEPTEKPHIESDYYDGFKNGLRTAEWRYDKLRAEIADYQKDAFYSNDVIMPKKMVLAIIDKYKAESERT